MIEKREKIKVGFVHLGGEVEVMLWRIITGCNYEARVNEGKSGIKIEENA